MENIRWIIQVFVIDMFDQSGFNRFSIVKFMRLKIILNMFLQNVGNIEMI